MSNGIMSNGLPSRLFGRPHISRIRVAICQVCITEHTEMMLPYNKRSVRDYFVKLIAKVVDRLDCQLQRLRIAPVFPLFRPITKCEAEPSFGARSSKKDSICFQGNNGNATAMLSKKRYCTNAKVP
jgi:hypothetical protein